jgi:hypothetical protein
MAFPAGLRGEGGQGVHDRRGDGFVVASGEKPDAIVAQMFRASILPALASCRMVFSVSAGCGGVSLPAASMQLARARLTEPLAQ